MDEWFYRWIEKRNQFPKSSIIVTNKWKFGTFADMTKGLGDVVYNLVNPCDTPNPDVLSKVKRTFYEKNGIFQDN